MKLATEKRAQSRTAPRPTATARKAPAVTLSTTALGVPKARRRPWLAILGAVLVVAAALASVLIYQAVGTTKAVVAVRQTIMRGSIISRADLTTLRISGEAANGTIPASQIDSVVGRHAGLDLAGGSVVLRSELSDDGVPHAGKSLVGVSVASGQVPAGNIRVGDNVRLIIGAAAQQDTGTTGSASNPSPAAAPAPIFGVVTAINPADVAGRTPVVVEVADKDAPNLATAAAAGRVAIVVDPMKK